MPSSFARFNIANRPAGLPETMGSVSTSSLPVQNWNEFWDKISHPNITRYVSYDSCGSIISLLGLFIFFMCLSSWLISVDLTYLYFPLAFMILLIHGSIYRWWWTRSLSKVREICAEYSPVFESAGFRVDYQRELPEDGRPPGYYIYFYPVTLDFQRIEIANETLFGCSTTKQSLLSPDDDFIPNAMQTVSPKTWDNFWTAIEKDVGAFVSATRRFCVLSCIWFFMILFCSIPVNEDEDNVENVSSFFWILYLILVVIVVACFLFQCFYGNEMQTAKSRLQSTIDTYASQFKEQGVKLEIRKEYDWSYSRSWNHVTGNLRWCLYLFPMQTAVDAPKLDNHVSSHVEMV